MQFLTRRPINKKGRIMVHRLTFVSVGQFRSLGDESRGEKGGVLDTPLLAATIIEEVRKPGVTLKAFLLNGVLSNHGWINHLEIRDLVTHLFVNEKADEVLAALDRDKCLGYSPEEIAGIRLTLTSPNAADSHSTAIREALGFKIPRRF